MLTRGKTCHCYDFLVRFKKIYYKVTMVTSYTLHYEELCCICQFQKQIIIKIKQNQRAFVKF